MNNILEQISVDIILPNYNSSSYLEETLVSVINQTFKNWKLFIVDDNHQPVGAINMQTLLSAGVI